MKLLKLILITLLSIAIGACGGAATEQKKADGDKDATTSEKKVETAKEDDTGTNEEADSSNDTPTIAIKEFVEANKSKDVQGVKKRLAAKMLDVMEKGAKQKNEILDDQIKAFIESGNMPTELPETKNEKIDGDKATIEVNIKNKWVETPLVKEDGVWKLDFTKQ